MIEYNWEVLEILNGAVEPVEGEEGAAVDDRIGAIVFYTPLDADLAAVEKFVPVPWQKAIDRAHAEEMLAGKIDAYAPVAEWEVLKNPPPPDKSNAITAEIKGDAMPTGQKREPPPPRREPTA